MSDPYKFPSPVTEGYEDAEPGSPRDVERYLRQLQLDLRNLGCNNIRWVREALEKVRANNGWNIWPEGRPAKTPKRMIELITGNPAKDFLVAVEVFAPDEARKLAWVEVEEREAAAVNLTGGNPAGGNQYESGCKGVTLASKSEPQDKAGYQRRLQKWANDTEDPIRAAMAKDLLRRIDDGEISTNAAAVEAGMRPKRRTFLTTDPSKAVTALLRVFSREQLLTALQEKEDV